MPRHWLGLCAVALLLPMGCGSPDKPRLVVSAASSLGDALSSCGDPSTELSFAGSDQLAAQIRTGVRPDVFAAANMSLPDELAALGLVDEPVVFATNEVVMAVPARNDTLRSLSDAGNGGVRIAMGSQGVPVGTYTRMLLSGLSEAKRKAILANVRSTEPDVRGILGKLTQGAVDAGFVYRTDVAAARGKLRVIELPAELQPRVAYAAAVVRGGRNPAGAREYVEGLRDGPCAEALARAGFGDVP